MLKNFSFLSLASALVLASGCIVSVWASSERSSPPFTGLAFHMT